MFRLRSLRVDKFRDLRGGAEFTFGRGVHLVLGRNASGKTNLLKLIAMIGRGDFSPLAGEEFAFEWEMEGGSGEPPVMRGRIEQGAPPAELLADPRFAMAGALPRPFAAEFELRLSGRTVWLSGTSRDGWRVRIDEDEPRLVSASVDLFGGPVFLELGLQLAEQHGGLDDPTVAVLLFGFAGGGRYDEGLLCFQALLGGVVPGPEVVPVVPNAIISKGMESTAWQVGAVGLMRKAFGEPTADDPRPMIRSRAGDSDLGSLAVALGADLVEFKPREVSRSSPSPGTTEVNYRGLDLRLTFGDRSISDPSLLSYGQRRLIAFFWYAASSPMGILVADELGNGLHHSWLRACFEEIGERQAFIAAQDPLVFDHVEFADAADMRARVIVCTPTPPNQPGGRGWLWRQPDEGEAAEFMAAYDVGIQKVSELLRAHGLW